MEMSRNPKPKTVDKNAITIKISAERGEEKLETLTTLNVDDITNLAMSKGLEASNEYLNGLSEKLNEKLNAYIKELLNK